MRAGSTAAYSQKVPLPSWTNSCSGICGHYTQVVWAASLELGCGLSSCPGLAYGSTIVCNYGPGGNDGGRPY